MRLAVIGAGKWGSIIINNLKEMCINHDICNTTGVYQDQPCSDDWMKVLHSKPDGIILAANPAINLPIMNLANILGIPVMVEKPVAFYLSDIQKMEKFKIPILVNYIHLFNPHYQAMKAKIQSPITMIMAYHWGKGPFRHFSGLFDYGPHPLSLACDLVPDELVPVDAKAYTNRETQGRTFDLSFKAKDTNIHIITGNGADHSFQELKVFTKDGEYSYIDDKTQAPLKKSINHFINVIHGTKPNPPFSLTSRIHTALFKAGNKWEKDKR